MFLGLFPDLRGVIDVGVCWCLEGTTVPNARHRHLDDSDFGCVVC